MAQEIAIVTYGNGDILREIFNAVAAGMGDSTFQDIDPFEYLVRRDMGNRQVDL